MTLQFLLRNNELEQDKVQTVETGKKALQRLLFSIAISLTMCPANKGLVDMANRAFETPKEYFSVSTIAVNPDRIDEVSYLP